MLSRRRDRLDPGRGLVRRGLLLPTSNPDLVANTVLFCAVPLVATVGARFYYQHAAAKGVVLGLFMFAVAGSLDAVITVPLLIMPAGGSLQKFLRRPRLLDHRHRHVAAAVALYSYCAKPSYKAIPNETRPCRGGQSCATYNTRASA